jgi:Tol biopolymer transport system component
MGGPGAGAHSAVNPPSRRILYVSDWSGSYEIYALDPTTGRRGQLTLGRTAGCVATSPCGFVAPMPWPDGRRILFRDRAFEDAGLAHADGPNLRLVPVDQLPFT